MLNKNLVLVFLILTFYASYSTASRATSQELNQNSEHAYIESRLLVKTASDCSLASLASVAHSIGAVPVKSFSLVPNLWLYEYDESVTIDDAISAFLSSGCVLYAEPDYTYYADAQNDPRFLEQWALENIGQTGGTIDADINADLMWQIEDGNPTIVIGVIDSGVDYDHLDLAPNLFRNLLEIPGNGIDEDLNGYIDDIYGINAIANSGDPLDDSGHGTLVAGTIGAEGNNFLGVVGVAQDVQIAPCKFLNTNGVGATSDAIQCLEYFADLKTRLLNPVNIVATNNSWGSTASSIALMDAIRAHQDLDILFVAAAGNNNVDNDQTPYYPASFDLANIISVAATDDEDARATFSNFGRRSVHVGAPGVQILSTFLNQNYFLFSGTSIATPHVTGLAAIVKSRFPDFDYKRIKNLIIASGTEVSSLANTTVTGRRIRGAAVDGRGALTCINQVVTSRLKPIANSITINLGETVFLSALNINCDLPIGSLTVYSDPNQIVTLSDNGINGDLTADDGVSSLLWQPIAGGTYELDFNNGDVVTVIVNQQDPSYQVSSVEFGYDTITGASISVGDETVRTVNVPFPIHFAGNAVGFTKIYVGSNGTISFTNTNNPGYLNRALPTTVAATLVVPFWDDLIPSGSNSNVFVATTGSAPERKFIVEWRNMKHYNAIGTGTFQAVFFENSPDIRFNYLDTNFNNTNFNSGKSATVGVQTSTTVATQYSFNAANIPSESSLLLSYE